VRILFLKRRYFEKELWQLTRPTACTSMFRFIINTTNCLYVMIK